MEHRSVNARSPFVVDVHDLSRRPGTMRTLELTIPAPSDMGGEVIGIPQGSDIFLDLRLESVMDGVLATGTIETEAVGECIRCLEPVHEHVDADLTELFVYPERAEAAEESGDEEIKEQVYEIVNESVDLEIPLRDTVVTQLPFQPLCDSNCRGLCAQCGVRLSDPENADHFHEDLDPRWKALSALAGETEADEPPGGELA